MSPHHGAVLSEVDVGTTNTNVPLNIRHPELSWQTSYQHTLKIIPNSGAIRYPHLPHALLNMVHTRMCVINNSGLNACGRSNLRMTV